MKFLYQRTSAGPINLPSLRRLLSQTPDHAQQRWIVRFTSFLSAAAVLAVLGFLPLLAAAQSGEVEQTGSSSNNYFYYADSFNSGTLNNTQNIKGIYNSLSASSSTPYESFDTIIGGSSPSGNYYWAVGLLAGIPGGTDTGTVIINNAPGYLIEGLTSGSGSEIASGIYATEPNTTINNSGTINAEVENQDGAGAAIYKTSDGGNTYITNASSGTVETTVSYDSLGIGVNDAYTNGSGVVYVTNNGAIKVTGTSGLSGSMIGYGYAEGIDVDTYDPNENTPIYVTNTGTITTATTGSASYEEARGINIWTDSGNATVTNSGTISSSISSSTDCTSAAGSYGLYLGGMYGTLTFINTPSGTLSATGGCGFTLDVENDASSASTIINNGTISHSGGEAINFYGAEAPTTIVNTGTIKGGQAGIQAPWFGGSITINDTGTVSGGSGNAMYFNNSGSNTINLQGLPSITGSITGSGNGTNYLNFNLIGTLQSVNSGSNQISGLDWTGTLYDLASSGSIIVSGQMYTWSGMTSVSGTVSSPLATGAYELVNENSGLALDNGSTKTSGSGVEQWTANNGAAQQWDITYLGNGTYKIVSAYSGLALDNGSTETIDNQVIQFTANGGQQQQWVILPVGNGYYRLINQYSGMALDNGSTSNVGVAVIQNTQSSSATQLWKIIAE
jgi:hypothetical protein